MRTFKDILSVPQLFIFKLNHKYNLPLHLIIYNNDSVDVLPITSRCISDQVTKFPIRSRDDEFPIKSRSVPTKCVRSHDVFRTTYEMSDLIRIRIGSEGATDSSSKAQQTAVSSSAGLSSGVGSGGQKESIFVRLSNKIKVLEQNLNMSTLYMEQLHQR